MHPQIMAPLGGTPLQTCEGSVISDAINLVLEIAQAMANRDVQKLSEQLNLIKASERS
jgi:hypothetical protein